MDRNTKLLLALLFTGTLMGAIDLAIIGPALPVIQNEFNMQQRELSALLNFYTLLQMIGALVLAKLADRYGPRLIYIISISLFATGSLIMIMADVTWMLYLGRAVQGFGVGGILPAAAATIGAKLPANERGQALGILGMVWGVAFFLGPILGGILLRFSWQWLFAINLPISLILIIGAIKMLPADSQRRIMPFDIKGLCVLIFTMSALVLGITNIETNALLESLLSLKVTGCFLLMLALIPFFWRIEKKAIDPIVKPDLFSSSQVSKSCIISVGVSAIQSGSIFLPALLVLALNVTPADSSFLLLPGVVAATIAAPIFGRMINIVGTRFILLIGQILVLGALSIYSFTDMTMGSFIFASIISGIGSSALVGAPLRYIMLTETGSDDRASAQGLLSVASSTGRLLGAAIVGAVATSQGGGEFGYQSAFSGMVILAVIIILVIMTLNSKRKEKISAEG
ncbi:MAG: MFS transporter [Pseudomonadota bacterium]|nr:MFS transporter [Pseudomonadota bacterium]